MCRPTTSIRKALPEQASSAGSAMAAVTNAKVTLAPTVTLALSSRLVRV
jgi:hypothetical protein